MTNLELRQMMNMVLDLVNVPVVDDLMDVLVKHLVEPVEKAQMDVLVKHLVNWPLLSNVVNASVVQFV